MALRRAQDRPAISEGCTRHIRIQVFDGPSDSLYGQLNSGVSTKANHLKGWGAKLRALILVEEGRPSCRRHSPQVAPQVGCGAESYGR